MVYMNEIGLGQLVQQARKHAGFTQQDLCDAAKLSYSTLAKIERGAIKSPSIFTIQNIADALGLSLDILLGHEVAEQGSVNQNISKSQSKSGIKFVYFDINGCLVRFYHHAFTKIAIDTGASSDVIESTFWHYNDLVCRGEMSLEDFNTALAEALRVPSIDWSQYYLDAVSPITEMHELAVWASQHYQVGLLSNIMPGQIDKMIELGLLPDIPYAAIVDSSEVMAIKPEHKIYEIATALAGVDPL